MRAGEFSWDFVSLELIWLSQGVLGSISPRFSEGFIAVRTNTPSILLPHVV